MSGLESSAWILWNAIDAHIDESEADWSSIDYTDEDALYDALTHNKIAGAGIDVLENEPINHTHRLVKLNNVVYTPHIGGSTDESLKRVGMKVCVLTAISRGETARGM